MEIEVKATYDDREEIRKKLSELGAEPKKVKHQIDEYYNHPSIDTRETNEYIRLRYKPDGKDGVFAHHINVADGVNKEFEVEVSDVQTFKQILNGLKFPLLGVIDKKRESYVLDEFTITLDDVKEVDNFIEVEVDGEEDEINEKKESCFQMLEKLGVPREKVCKKVWLCDIATGKIKYSKN